MSTPGIDMGEMLNLLDESGRLVAPPADRHLAAALRVLAGRDAVGHCLSHVMSTFDPADVETAARVVLHAASSFHAVESWQPEAVQVVAADEPGEAVEPGDVSRLLALCAAWGVPVRFGRIEGAHGLCSAADGIVVDPATPNLALVLAHEIGHELVRGLGLLAADASRAMREGVADVIGAALLSSGASTVRDAVCVARACVELPDCVALADDGGMRLDVELYVWWGGLDLSSWRSP